MFETRDQNNMQPARLKIYDYPIRPDKAYRIRRVIYMGRTVPSFRMLLEGIVEELSAFRRALRGNDRAAFDSLMNMARQHASSCTVTPLFDPIDAVFLSILIEQQKEINALREALSTDGKTYTDNQII